MIGSMANALSGFFKRLLLPRSATKAISVPSTVVPAAVSKAKNKVFHATPQLTPPAKQPSPQTRTVPMRSHTAPNANSPPSLYSAAISDLPTGNTTNKANKAVQPITEADTNTSPRK